MNTFAFGSFSNCYALDVTAASQNIAVPSPVPSNTAVQVQYQLCVVGVEDVFVNFGLEGTVPVAVIPASGANAPGMMIPGNGSMLTVSLPAGSVVAAIAAGPGSTLYINAGYGV